MSQKGDDLLNSINNLANDSLGFAGGLYIGDMSAHVGNWIALTALTAVTFTTVLDPLVGTKITGITSATIPAGVTIYLNCSSLTLAGGTCIVYSR